MMKKVILILSLCSNLCFGGWAQEEDLRPVTSGLSIGIGKGNEHNTYLTNLHYEGTALDVHYDRVRLMRQRKWNNLQMVDFSYMDGDDQQSGLSSVMAGRLRYRFAMHRVWRPTAGKFQFFAGPYAGLDIGFDYNLKLASGNNPATVRLTENFGLSAGSSWSYHIRRQPCVLNFVIQTPLFGTALVPEYGASYYEAFYLNPSDRDYHFTSLNNQQDLDFRLTTDLPVSIAPCFKRYGSSLRLGVAYHIETMDVNDIVTRYSTFQFVIGWTWQYLPYKSPRHE